jgi:hypothetical protein
MTIRLETDPAGEPHTVWFDGRKYTLDELRNHLARSAALTTVLVWLGQERATTRRQRKLLGHWQRYGAGMQATARTQAEELARLRRKPERGCYALEAAQRTKEQR